MELSQRKSWGQWWDQLVKTLHLDRNYKIAEFYWKSWNCNNNAQPMMDHQWEYKTTVCTLCSNLWLQPIDKCSGVMMTEEELADMVEVKPTGQLQLQLTEVFKQSLDLLLWMLCNHQDADRDGSGSMDFQEFVEMMIKVDFFFIFSFWTFSRENQRKRQSWNSNRLFEFLTRLTHNQSLHWTICLVGGLEYWSNVSGWQRLYHLLRIEVCPQQVEKNTQNSRHQKMPEM